MIYLYKNKLPNYAENTHVFFQRPDRFVAWLGDPFMSFPEDRYTLNANTAEVLISNVADYDDVTYIAWNFGDAWRFYFVKSAIYQSGYAIFTLDVDLWATHIWRARLSNLRVTRSNKNVGVGVYEPIPVTSGIEYERLGDDLNTDDLCIVFVATFATGISTILGNKSGALTGVYMSPINELFEDEALCTIDNAIACIGGIYSAAATVGEVDANVIRAYLAPTNCIINKVAATPVFRYKAPSMQGEINPMYEVAPYTMPVPFEIPIDPNYKYFVGTKHNGLELARVTSNASVIYNFITKQDGLQVIVQQGDRMRDITSDFEVGLTTNDGNLTSSQNISRTLQLAGGLASGSFQIMQGGAGLVTGAISAANSLNGLMLEGNAQYSQGGDGVTTFRRLNGAGQSPFYMQKNRSVDNEAEAARLYGAGFNQCLNNVNVIFEADFLGEGSLTDTFFAAELRVDGVPSDACDVISSAIRAGVYAVYV